MRFNKILTIMACIAVAACGEGDIASNESQTGQGGSMTRFAISGNTLYVVNNFELQVYDITSNTFTHVRDVAIDMGIETVFAKGEYLYLGATDGMYIYSIVEHHDPTFIFKYSHILSCDPVVVQGNRAYVTLLGGNECNRGANALEILDISDPYNPTLIANYPMLAPHGLGVSNNLLFLCEGEYGFKVYDITDETQIQLVTHITTHHAYDVIVRGTHAIVTGQDGIFQYGYTLLGELDELSKIPVDRDVF